MPRLNESDRNRAIGQLEAGVTISEVARRFNVQRRVIRNLRTRFEQTGSTNDLPRTGRPRVTTPKEDRYIALQHLRNRFLPAQHTAARLRVSRNTVMRRLRIRGLFARRPVFGQRLLPRQRANRLQWSLRHRFWTLNQWENVLWSDESTFLVDRRDSRLRVYRRVGERFANNCIREVSNRSTGSVMIWGAITTNFRTACVRVQGTLTAQRYINEVLTPHVIPLINRHPNMIFMHDNAPAHRAILTTRFLEEQGVTQLSPWPAYSPDLNPIEHLWNEMEISLRRQERQPTNAHELATDLIRIWNEIPLITIRRLTLSMRRRIDAVIQANGGHTRY